MRPLITIGIPFYNAECFLADAIQSVINQSFQDWELLLIDDGSKDGSVEIAKKFLLDDRIKLIVDCENKGLVFRLNQQISLAKGKYFARMDADDIMHPFRIEKQVCFLESNPCIDAVGSYAYSIDTKNNVSGMLITNPYPRTLSDVFNHKCFIHPSVMAKSEWYKNNLYNSKYIRMEDKELWARVIQQSNFANLTVPLLFYRDIGIPQLKKYLQSMKGDRALIKNTFLRFFSVQKWQLLFKNYAKCFLYIVFTICRQQDFLIKRRGTVVSDVEKQKASDILNETIKTNIQL